MSPAPNSAELREHNRRIIAERLGWPAGAAQACQNIEADNPGWSAYWQPADARHAEGWYAIHDNHFHLEPPMYGATPEQLHAAIRAHRCARMS